MDLNILLAATMVVALVIGCYLNRKSGNIFGNGDGDLTVKVGRQPLTAERGTVALARLQEQLDWVNSLPQSDATKWAAERITEWMYQLQIELQFLNIQAKMERLENLKKGNLS